MEEDEKREGNGQSDTLPFAPHGRLGGNDHPDHGIHTGAFRRYVEGENVTIEYRWGAGSGPALYEAVACDERCIAAFDLIRYRRNGVCVFLNAFDLIELNGDDLRRDPLVVRKATLA